MHALATRRPKLLRKLAGVALALCSSHSPRPKPPPSEGGSAVVSAGASAVTAAATAGSTAVATAGSTAGASDPGSTTVATAGSTVPGSTTVVTMAGSTAIRTSRRRSTAGFGYGYGLRRARLRRVRLSLLIGVRRSASCGADRVGYTSGGGRAERPRDFRRDPPDPVEPGAVEKGPSDANPCDQANPTPPSDGEACPRLDARWSRRFRRLGPAIPEARRARESLLRPRLSRPRLCRLARPQGP